MVKWAYAICGMTFSCEVIGSLLRYCEIDQSDEIAQTDMVITIVFSESTVTSDETKRSIVWDSEIESWAQI